MNIIIHGKLARAGGDRYLHVFAMELTGPEQWKELVDSVDTFIFDCDGVIWTGTDEIITGAQDVIKLLREKGKNVYFVTNNSSKSREEYLQKFVKLGFEAHENEVFPTSFIAAYYLKNMMKFTKKVYLFGLPGLVHELDLQGIPCIGPGPDPVVGGPAEWAKMTLDPEVGAVLVGYDNQFSFMKLTKACSYLKNPNCLFFATNEDACLPINSDTITIPGTGCIVNSVKHGSGREPTVVGKPHNPIFEVIQHNTKLDPTKTLMIGDSLHTDIVFGLRHGMKTLLVLTGLVKRGDINNSETKPAFFSESIAGILSCSTLL